MVGTWHLRLAASLHQPRGASSVWEFGDDRVCRIREIDPSTGAILREPYATANKVDGRWRVADGTLTIIWGDSTLMRIRRALPACWPGSLHTVVYGCHIESITASELMLKAGGGKSYKLRRAPAD
jgi:hypothetical protein